MWDFEQGRAFVSFEKGKTHWLTILAIDPWPDVSWLTGHCPQAAGSLVPRGKMKRIAFQFTPYSWVRFEWKPASSLHRWLAVCGIILVVSPNSLGTVNLCTTSGSRTDELTSHPLVPAGRAEHILPEVCAMDAS